MTIRNDYQQVTSKKYAFFDMQNETNALCGVYENYGFSGTNETGPEKQANGEALY
jgi:hypothetical protein